MSKEKSATLLYDFVVAAKQAAAVADGMKANIEGRLDYIMKCIFDCFNMKDAFWYFKDAGEGEVGNLWDYYTDEHIDVVIETRKSFGMLKIITNEDMELSLVDGIPTRWLFIDFENELLEGKEKFIERQVRVAKINKEKRQIEKIEEKELADAAKLKLSKKELDALKKVLK